MEISFSAIPFSALPSYNSEDNSSKINKPIFRRANFYLNVPYREKDEAKKLGARWNPKVKKWYINCPPNEYVKFSKWILNGYEQVLIVSNSIAIIEGKRECWKCGNETKVIGFGIKDYINIFDGEDSENGEPFFEVSENFGSSLANLHLAWAYNEDDIPPILLNYLKNHYSVMTGYSNTIGGKCFANHCDCCGALQGNWFLFNEPDSPLSSCCSDKNELRERMSNLKIKIIPIKDNIQLDWSSVYCTADFAYLKYANVERLVLAKNERDIYASYEELYDFT